MNPTIIGIAGQFGAGKTTIAMHAATCLGFQYVRYSSALESLREEHGKQALSMVDFGAWANQQLGQKAVAEHILQRITGDAIIDGLRFLEDHDAISGRFVRYRLVYIEVPTNQRQLQWCARTGLGLQDFEVRDAHAVEAKVTLLRPFSDYIIDHTDLRKAQTLMLFLISQWKLEDWGCQ